MRSKLDIPECKIFYFRTSSDFMSPVLLQKASPACAVCRAALSTFKPLLPNYSLDAVVQQYIRALAVSGRSEWQEKGDRLAEWRKRHE